MLFRTHTTNLTDDELSLLDVMFDAGVTPAMLRQCNFRPQFAVETHSLDDASLNQTLRRFLHDDITAPIQNHQSGRQYIQITRHGASLWSSERCPDWTRYCSYRQFGFVHGQAMISVRFVSAVVRDDFLNFGILNPTRTKKATIRDTGLLQWKSFAKLHVGLASFPETANPTVAEFTKWSENLRKHEMIVEPKRSWWETVRELQKFTGTSESAG